MLYINIPHCIILKKCNAPYSVSKSSPQYFFKIRPLFALKNIKKIKFLHKMRLYLLI